MSVQKQSDKWLADGGKERDEFKKIVNLPQQRVSGNLGQVNYGIAKRE